MNALVPSDYYGVKGLQGSSRLPFTDRDYVSLEGAQHLVGRTCLHVARHDDDKISFIFDDGSFVVMQHHQDCCEQVEIEDINGNLDDLLGVRLDVAEERQQEDPSMDEYGSGTWTFYCFRTIKGSIDIRWYGSSNGYYSEAVDLDIRQPAEPLSQDERRIFAEEVKTWRAARGL